MQGNCSVRECGEPAAASIEEHAYCLKHFLLQCYERLDAIATQLHQRQFQETQSDAARRFLESCMRDAADIACAVLAPPNIEKAQLLDVLLWASELHGRLRRSPRLMSRTSVLLRSRTPGRFWEEKTETVLLSRHGAQITCSHQVVVNELLSFVSLDKGWETEVRVAWVLPRAPDIIDVGVEFLTDKNFWGLDSEGSAVRPGRESPEAEARYGWHEASRGSDV
jgi:hypothetical protein